MRRALDGDVLEQDVADAPRLRSSARIRVRGRVRGRVRVRIRVRGRVRLSGVSARTAKLHVKALDRVV